MKIIAASVVILVLITAACLGSALYVTNSVTSTASMLEQALTIAEQNPLSAQSVIQAATAQWDRCATVFGTVLQHDEVDSVMEDFARLDYYAQTDNEEEFLSTCAALLAKLNHIRDMEWPTLKNIL